MEITKSTSSDEEETKHLTTAPTSPKKQIRLHVGFPKTGTTSIQTVLCQASDHLIASGHWYPRLAGFKNRKRIAYSHHSLFRALTLPEPDDVVSERQVAEADFANVLERLSSDSDLNQLIISHEGFFENFRPNFDILQQLAASHSLTIIAYVRCYDQWIESRYTQYVKESRGQIRALRKFYLGQLESSFFLSRLQAFREQLPDCQFCVRSFDAAKATGLVQDFLGQAGIQEDSVLQRLIGQKGESNRGRLPILSFFKAYATAGPDGDELAGFVEDALQSLGDELSNVPFADRRFGFLPYDLKRRARQLYQDDVKQLREQFDAQIPVPEPVSVGELKYATRLTKREYQQTLDFLRPHFEAGVADRIQASFSTGARAIEGSWRFLRRLGRLG